MATVEWRVSAFSDDNPQSWVGALLWHHLLTTPDIRFITSHHTIRSIMRLRLPTAKHRHKNRNGSERGSRCNEPNIKQAGLLPTSPNTFVRVPRVTCRWRISVQFFCSFIGCYFVRVCDLYHFIQLCKVEKNNRYRNINFFQIIYYNMGCNVSKFVYILVELDCGCALLYDIYSVTYDLDHFVYTQNRTVSKQNKTTPLCALTSRCLSMARTIRSAWPVQPTQPSRHPILVECTCV